MPYNYVAVQSCNFVYTPQPLYNTIVGVQDNIRVSNPIRVITRVKCVAIQQKKFLMTIWGPAMIRVISKSCYNEPCYKEVEVYVYFMRMLKSNK